MTGTLILICGYFLYVTSLEIGLPDFFIVFASNSPVRSPSPVVLYVFTIMCPEGSPPSSMFLFFIISITYLSPTSALSKVIPFLTKAFSKPLLESDVPTTKLFVLL